MDLARLVEVRGDAPGGGERHSPAERFGREGATLAGGPDPAHTPTSPAERQNPAMRMHMRRFTRPTDGSSRRVGDHAADVAPHFVRHDLARVRQPLRATPATAAGATGRPWGPRDVVALLDARGDAQEAA